MTLIQITPIAFLLDVTVSAVCSSTLLEKSDTKSDTKPKKKRRKSKVCQHKTSIKGGILL